MMAAKKRVMTEAEKLQTALQALARICELASDQEVPYPERIGAIKYQAAYTLHRRGDSTWWNKINEQRLLPFLEGP